MNQYKTTLEVEITPLYDYTPEDALTYDHPGSPVSVDVWGVEVEGVELTENQFVDFWYKLPESTRDEIEQGIMEFEWKKARDAAEYKDESRREALAEGALLRIA